MKTNHPKLNDTQVVPIRKSEGLPSKWKWHAKIYEYTPRLGKNRWGHIGQFETKREAMAATVLWRGARIIGDYANKSVQ